MSSNQTVDFGVAALAKVVGAAHYEAGVSADALNTSTGMASSKFSSQNPVQRMIWGVRAMVGDVIGKQDLKRDEITFRMMDLKLFKAVEKELKQLDRCFEGDTFRSDLRDTQAAQGIYNEIKHRVESSSLNSSEQKVLLKYVHTILNLGNMNREEYDREVRSTYNSSTDTQYEKVREDAKHRWRGFASNLIVSSLAKFSSVVLSPLATPIVGIAGVAAVETFIQGLLKSRMEECSLKTKTSQLSRAVNKQIEGFYSVDSDTPITDRAVPTDPLGRPPMARLAHAAAALDNMNGLTEKEKAERFNEASDVARFVLENARDLEELSTRSKVFPVLVRLADYEQMG